MAEHVRQNRWGEVRRGYLRMLDGLLEVPEQRLRAVACNDALVDRMIDGMIKTNRKTVRRGSLIILFTLGMFFVPVSPGAAAVFAAVLFVLFYAVYYADAMSSRIWVVYFLL